MIECEECFNSTMDRFQDIGSGEDEHGEFTDCGHRMYSVRDNMAYHGCLCPGCMCNGIQRTLYIRGSKESNEYWDNKLKKQR